MQCTNLPNLRSLMSFMQFCCTNVKPKHHFDRLILPADAPPCLIIPCENRRWAWARSPPDCLSIRWWESGIAFSPGFFMMAPQMTWAHAEPFRATFILICNSRGWNEAASVSLHRSPRSPISPAQRRDATMLMWCPLWITRQLPYAFRTATDGWEQFRTDYLHELRHRGRIDRHMSDPSNCSRRLPVSLISSPCRWKTEMECCLQSRPLACAEMSLKSSRSKVSWQQGHNNAT